ncbi:MAG: septum formation protein Maf [Planctomycetota bacterium]|nr:MAG: septum formation protein Maf [Planctomycetota bacterium]
MILSEHKIPFKIIVPNVDEVTLASPIETALTNAQLKAENVFKDCPNELILASDTVVAVDDLVLGKPQDEDDAKRILNLISDKRQAVISAYCLMAPNIKIIDYDTTWVTMREITAEEINDYIGSGEPFGKAGAYAIQENGDKFVTKIEGSFNNVVGLPIEKIIIALNKLH